MNNLDITAVTLTKNEARNLRACLESIKNHVRRIVVIDSDSTDDTVSIAKEYGCEVYNFPSATQATIYKWFFAHVQIDTDWVLRIDADERWTANGIRELEPLLSNPNIDGIYVNRKTYFMGTPLMWGGYYPIRLLLVWRSGKARVEDRLMDEHMIVDGKTHLSAIDVLEQNYDRQQNLSLWTAKHNRYSDRYAAEEVLMDLGYIKRNILKFDIRNFTSIKSLLRVGLYDRSPLLFRVFIYYFFRYFIQLGFLDGKNGFIYHFLQAFWFRFLVDSKIIQIKNEIKARKVDPVVYLADHYGIRYKDGGVYFD